MSVVIWQGRSGHRARVVSEAMSKGIKRVSGRAEVLSEANYSGTTSGTVAVFYGLQGNLARIFKDYVSAGKKAVYIDLGYWQRHQDGRYSGYHKLCVNSRHPTEYFQKHAHDDRRWKALGLQEELPWRRGEQIVIAGMSEKAARAEGFSAQQWERQAVAELRKYTQRPIVYRPKPNWPGATPINGTAFGDKTLPLQVALKDCHALVTHHSNAALEALMLGVPVFSISGVATAMGRTDLSMIETPTYPETRRQWAQDIAYTQWTLAEMEKGLPWRHMLDEGLV